MLRIELHPEASQEVRTAVDWYEERRAGLGAEFFTELRNGLAAIATSPHTFPPWPDARARTLGIRRAVMKRFPFVVPYMVLDERVFVLAIAHARRHPSYWLRRASHVSHH